MSDLGAPTAAQLAARRHRVAADLGGRPLLVTTLVNIRYLSGFTGSNGALLLRPDGSGVLWTDGRYRDQAAAEVPDLEIVVDRDLLGAAAALVGGEQGAPTLLVETHTLSVDALARLESTGVATASADAVVERARVVKDEHELAALREACRISVEALTDLLAGPLLGRTEREVARDLEWRMLTAGAEAVGFETICAAGENAAIPHHAPGERVLEPGDLLVVDFGARVAGYHADCTRTVVLGPPAGWQRDIHAAVQRAQALGVDHLGAGSLPADVDRLVRDDLDAAGWGEHFTTGLGHGVGLVIHEDPFFGPRSTAPLQEATVLTMEPGIYLPGRGGVRIEDTVVVTASGPEVLTPLDTDLLEL